MKKIELLTKYYNSSYDDTFDNLHLEGDDLFSTYAKFFEKLTFLTPPDTNIYVCASGDKEC